MSTTTAHDNLLIWVQAAIDAICTHVIASPEADRNNSYTLGTLSGFARLLTLGTFRMEALQSIARLVHSHIRDLLSTREENAARLDALIARAQRDYDAYHRRSTLAVAGA